MEREGKSVVRTVISSPVAIQLDLEDLDVSLHEDMIQTEQAIPSGLPIAVPATDDLPVVDDDLDRPETQTLVIEGVVVKKEKKYREKIFLALAILALAISLITIPLKKLSPHEAKSTSPISYRDFMRDIALLVSEKDLVDDQSSLQYFVWDTLSTTIQKRVEQGWITLDDKSLLIQEYVAGVVVTSTWSEAIFLKAKSADKGKKVLVEPCKYYPFVCNEEGEITGMIIVNKSVIGGGILPREIGSLSNLEHISLSRNELGGTIPSEIGMLEKLKILDLDENLLGGEIPKELGQLKNLEYFSIKSNMLENEIPSDLSDLRNLQYLGFAHNDLTGQIPSRFGELKELRGLELQKTDITGDLEFLCENIFETSTNSSLYTINSGVSIDCMPQAISMCSCCVCS